MTKVYLKTPSIDEIYHRRRWMEDPETMQYNAGYDVQIPGYNYEVGTIIKTDEEMTEWYNKWINKEPDKFFAYIYVEEILEPIGEIYYYLDNGIHNMGIVIASPYRGKGYSYYALLELEKIAFEKNKIDELSDFIQIDRMGAIQSFKKAGFIHTGLIKNEMKFDKQIESKQLIITKEMYDQNY